MRERRSGRGVLMVITSIFLSLILVRWDIVSATEQQLRENRLPASKAKDAWENTHTEDNFRDETEGNALDRDSQSTLSERADNLTSIGISVALPLDFLLKFDERNCTWNASVQSTASQAADPNLPRNITGAVTPWAANWTVNGNSSTTNLLKRQNDHCSKSNPCKQGCCGKSGSCGFGPLYCDGSNCVDTCDAKAECGQYALKENFYCPLNVCCSQFGFCNTLPEYCGAGCQSGCTFQRPSVSPSNVQQMVIGYYEAWSPTRKCDGMTPEQIPVRGLTHLIYSFAFMEGGSFNLIPMEGVSENTFGQVTRLKDKAAGLKVILAVGGWTHNDPGPFREVFSSMVSTSANRQKAISNILSFLGKWGFDGVDIDWEYPGADDRGGQKDDGVNFTKFLKELRQAIAQDGHSYTVTFTAPTSYWYLRHFDIKASSEQVDWINLMSYDLHGNWDADNPIGNQVQAHTNITEIDDALDLFWRNNVDPSKIVMGLGFYGRSFKLADPSCSETHCKFIPIDDGGGATPGKCTANSGTLSYKEIQGIIKDKGVKPKIDEAAAVNILVFDNDQWVAYDDANTFQKKIDLANKRGLLGVMIWAVDLDDKDFSALRAISGFAGADPTTSADTAAAISASFGDGTGCRITDCYTWDGQSGSHGGGCRSDEVAMTWTTEDPIRGYKACNIKKFQWRDVCCPAFSAPNPDQCKWRVHHAEGGIKTDCDGVCEAGEILITWDKHGDQGPNGCGRGHKVYCCPSGNKAYLQGLCKWTECATDSSGTTCPPGYPYTLAQDTGGNRDDPAHRRCERDWPFRQFYRRKLCCPSENTFKNCHWRGTAGPSKYCSDNSCAMNQVTLDVDPYADITNANCPNGRQRSLCCDPPDGLDNAFSPADLANLFPKKDISGDTFVDDYKIQFFGLHSERKRPGESGFAWILVTGKKSHVASLTKRSGSHLRFVQCPQSQIEGTPLDQVHTARVLCFKSGPDSNCDDIHEGGVEGTIVEVPEECDMGKYVRAISVKKSQNQTTDPIFEAQRPKGSDVLDFHFDYDFSQLKKRDGDDGDINVRIDYSNVPKYWDALVDSPGINKRSDDRSPEALHKRFFSETSSDWTKKIADFVGPRGEGIPLDSDLQREFNVRKLLFYSGKEDCPGVHGGRLGPQSLTMFLEGTVDVSAWFGFSYVGKWENGGFKKKEAAGFVSVTQSSQLSWVTVGQGAIYSRNVGSEKTTLYIHEGFQTSLNLRGFVDFKELVELKADFGGSLHLDGEIAFDTKLTTHRHDDPLARHTLIFPNPEEIKWEDEFSAGMNKDTVIYNSASDRFNVDFEIEVSLEIAQEGAGNSKIGFVQTFSTEQDHRESCAVVSATSNIGYIQQGESLWSKTADKQPVSEQFWNIGDKCAAPSNKLAKRYWPDPIIIPKGNIENIFFYRPAYHDVHSWLEDPLGIHYSQGYEQWRNGDIPPGLRRVVSFEYHPGQFSCVDSEGNDVDLDVKHFCESVKPDLDLRDECEVEGPDNDPGNVSGSLNKRHLLDGIPSLVGDNATALALFTRRSLPSDIFKKLEARADSSNQKVLIFMSSRLGSAVWQRKSRRYWCSATAIRKYTDAEVPRHIDVENANDCTLWGLTKYQNPLTFPGAGAANNYDTEHIFEGQTIDFFLQYLIDGSGVDDEFLDPNWEKPDWSVAYEDPLSPGTYRSLWVDDLFRDQFFTAMYDQTRAIVGPGVQGPHGAWSYQELAQDLMNLLGSTHDNFGLVIVERAANGAKGKLVHLDQPYSFTGRTTWRAWDINKKISKVREIGFIFKYMNDYADRFAHVSDAIQARLVEFDQDFQPYLEGEKFSLGLQWLPTYPENRVAFKYYKFIRYHLKTIAKKARQWVLTAGQEFLAYLQTDPAVNPRPGIDPTTGQPYTLTPQQQQLRNTLTQVLDTIYDMDFQQNTVTLRQSRITELSFDTIINKLTGAP